MRRVLAVILVGSVAAGCVDFVYPDIPGIENRGGPARLSARVIVTDSGRVSANATLRPGLDFEGYKRPVTRPFLRVMEAILEPDSVRRDGTLRYVDSWQGDPGTITGPLTLAAPRIEGVLGTPPAIEWFGLRRDGPASIRLSDNEDLLLPVAEVEGTSNPPPSIRQWFLDSVVGGSIDPTQLQRCAAESDPGAATLDSGRRHGPGPADFLPVRCAQRPVG